MAEPNVHKADGSVVPLGTWELDGLEQVVGELGRCVLDAGVGETTGMTTSDVYEMFGTKSFPVALALVRQLPKLIAELRVVRECVRQHRPQGLTEKYVVFKAAEFENYPNADPLTGCFVLRPARDVAAREALRTYARETRDVKLTLDLHDWLDGLPPP